MPQKCSFSHVQTIISYHENIMLVRMDLCSQGYFVVALGYNFLSGNSWDLVFAWNNYSGFHVRNTRIFPLSFCHFIADICFCVSGLTMCHQESGHDLSFILPYGKGLWKGMFGAVTIHSFPGCSKVLPPPRLPSAPASQV